MRPLRPGCEPPSAGDRATHPRAAPSPPAAHRSFRTVPADYSFQAASPRVGYASRNGEGELRQLRFEFALLVHDPDAALLAERRIGEHHREAFRPGSLAKLSTPDRIGDSSGAIPCRQRFMMQSRPVAGTIFQPCTKPFPKWASLGRLGQQALLDVALHVRMHRHPVLGLDQVHDQPLERRRVLDLLPGLPEDLP